MTYQESRKQGYELRNPAVLASRWQDREAAYLTDLARGGWGCEVLALDEDDKSSTLIMSAQDVYRPTSRQLGVFTSINWRIDHVIGDGPYVPRLARAIIHVSGIPNPETPTYGARSRDGIRPYKDMLFLDGAVTVIFSDSDTINQSSEGLNIGDVVGLNIVTDENIIPVWEPEY